jgi:hypothetical protein
MVATQDNTAGDARNSAHLLLCTPFFAIHTNANTASGRRVFRIEGRRKTPEIVKSAANTEEHRYNE